MLGRSGIGRARAIRIQCAATREGLSYFYVGVQLGQRRRNASTEVADDRTRATGHGLATAAFRRHLHGNLPAVHGALRRRRQHESGGRSNDKQGQDDSAQHRFQFRLHEPTEVHHYQRRFHMRVTAALRTLVMALAFPAATAGAQGSPLPSSSFSVPLNEQTGWQILQYRNLPPHRISFSKAGLEMMVDGSAMPLIYPLPAPLRVSSIRVNGRVEGTLRIPPERQGEKKFDDYVFRIGLVEPGERTLNFVQRQLAAAWVRKLFALAPQGGGISRIHFFNLGIDKAQIGQRRQHPISELIVEKVVAVPGPGGGFDFVHRLEQPLETIAVWLSSDGDDTGSKFTVLVENIQLQSR